MYSFVPIFVTDNAALYALKKSIPKNGTDVFTKLFVDWLNPLLVTQFFEKNKDLLPEWGEPEQLLESAANKVAQQAMDFRSSFKSKVESVRLDSLFENLHGAKETAVELIASKAKMEEDPNWLRIYGIKIESNCYIVTGGIIKLTQDMRKPPASTQKVILERVIDFLSDKKINTKQKLIEYINEQQQK